MRYGSCCFLPSTFIKCSTPLELPRKMHSKAVCLTPRVGACGGLRRNYRSRRSCRLFLGYCYSREPGTEQFLGALMSVNEEQAAMGRAKQQRPASNTASVTMKHCIPSPMLTSLFGVYSGRGRARRNAV